MSGRRFCSTDIEHPIPLKRKTFQANPIFRPANSDIGYNPGIVNYQFGTATGHNHVSALEAKITALIDRKYDRAIFEIHHFFHPPYTPLVNNGYTGSKIFTIPNSPI